MEYKIVAIRTKHSISNTADDITDVKLSVDNVETVIDVVNSIVSGSYYYYTD